MTAISSDRWEPEQGGVENANTNTPEDDWRGRLGRDPMDRILSTLGLVDDEKREKDDTEKKQNRTKRVLGIASRIS